MKETAIGNDYRIRRIPLNWVIEKKMPATEKRPDGGWKILGYYPGWKFLAVALVELHDGTPEGSNLEEQVAALMEQVRTSEEKIIRALGVALGDTRKPTETETLQEKEKNNDDS